MKFPFFFRKKMKDIYKNSYNSLDKSDINAFTMKDHQSLEAAFKDCSDIIFRNIKLPDDTLLCTLIYIEGLTDTASINNDIVKPLNRYAIRLNDENQLKPSLKGLESIIEVGELKYETEIPKLVTAVLSGDTVLIVEGEKGGLALDTKDYEYRAIEDSPVESVTRGPKEGFVENLITNISLIRRRIKSSDLKVKSLEVGSITKTSVSVLYMESIVSKDLLSDIIDKLENIQIDGIFDSGYIEQLLEESPYSFFPQMQITERPDKTSGNLLEGKIAILVDGSPDALILPTTFIQLLQSSEDYSERLIYVNLVRILRLAAFFIAVSFPAFYVSFVSFHQEILPANLILDLAKARTQVPFPVIVEALLMEATIEILKEASVRLPYSIGQTIGIVGVIVIGDAAVKANLVSPVMVIVVSITALSTYVFPHYTTSYSLRTMRFIMIIMASILGAFGIIITWIWIISHMCSLDSYGYPYLAPFAPLHISELKDTFFRTSLKNMKKRPNTANKSNKNKQ